MNEIDRERHDGDRHAGPFEAVRLGGLPSAAEFAEYEKAMPGAGERILALAERSLDQGLTLAAAERDRLDIANKREHLTRRLVQGFSILLSLSAVLVGAGILFLSGNWEASLIAVGVPLVSLMAMAMATRNKD